MLQPDFSLEYLYLSAIPLANAASSPARAADGRHAAPRLDV
jgi:hypothetical protein